MFKKDADLKRPKTLELLDELKEREAQIKHVAVRIDSKTIKLVPAHKIEQGVKQKKRKK